MFISKVFPGCLRVVDSDSEDSNPTERCDEEGNLNILSPHKSEKIFYLDSFHRIKETQVMMDFDTRCPILPSVWKVTVDMAILDLFINFHLLITMRRIDSGQIPIEGIVLVWFSNVTGKTCPIFYSVRKIIPYSIKPTKIKPFEDIKSSVHDSFLVNDHFKCLLNENFTEDSDKFLDDLLIVKIQLFVRGCCDCKVDHKSDIYSKAESACTWRSEKEGADIVSYHSKL